MASRVPSSAVLRRLLPYYHPYRGKVAFGLVLVVVSSALASVVPWLLREAIDAVRQNAPMRHIGAIAGGMVGVAILAGALRYWMRELLNGVSRFIEFDLRNDLFRQLVALDASYFARMRTGDLMARATNDLSAVRMAAGPAIMYLTNTIFGGLFALLFMLRIDVRLTVLALLPMILMPILTIRLGRRLHDRFEEVQEHFSTMTTMAQEHIAGVRVVRAYRQEGAEVERFGKLGEVYLAKNLGLARLYGIMHPAFSTLAGLGVVVVLGFGGQLVLEDRITVGSFVAFGFYLGILTWPLIALGWVVNLFQRGAASMRRLLDILDARSVLEESPAPRALAPVDRDRPGRRLEFRGVGFHYPAQDPDGPRWVLRDVSFVVDRGETLGIVGATASGKSALMDLVPRLHDPQEGEILLDGIPMRELPLDVLRREIGYVPQESFLFSDTIDANLAYGTNDAAAARWAATVAQLDETVHAFPGGYETMLGERGINLSGGQKQRTAIARALARHPSVVLLDDALSSVDTSTEAAIIKGLREALAGRTALIASHRVSAIRDATHSIVLDGGRVVERGRHEDLLALGGRYWSLLNRQELEDDIERAPSVATETAGR